MVKQISDNEIYLLIKYIKSVLWRIRKRLSYIEDARCLKVNFSVVYTNKSHALQRFQFLWSYLRAVLTFSSPSTFLRIFINMIMSTIFVKFLS